MAKILLSRFGSKKDLSLSLLSNQQQQQQQQIDYQCAIRLLDDEEVLQTTFQKDQKGQYLLDYVFKTLNLLEKDYFGLRFVDINNIRIWLDPTRLILKQIKHLNPIIFCFRVKYYPAQPILLNDELTRYYLYLQLRRDLLNRRLYCLPIDAIYLMACVVQSELGDYNENEHKNNYIENIKIIPNQNDKIEYETIELHKNEMKHLTPADAELKFLERASKLETYGIDPIQVKDHKKLQYLIGINYSGILCFQGNKKIYHYKWNDLQKITYEGKMFILHEYSGGKKNLVGFKCTNVSACQNLWRIAIEQRYFFTMNSSNDIPLITHGGGLFSKQCKLRYSGRVEREIIEDQKKMKTLSNNNNTTTSTINRRHSTNVMPSSIRSMGRSNTAPLPDDDNDKSTKFYQQNENNEDVKNPYLNYSIVSEPEHSTKDNNNLIKANCSMIVESIIDNDDDHNEQQQQQPRISTTTCLPTEFNLRPDITPTGDDDDDDYDDEQTINNMISFETPIVRSSPSQLSIDQHHQHSKQKMLKKQKSCEDDTITTTTSTTSTTNDSDETLEQISEIVDQTPSTYQQQQQQQKTQKKNFKNEINNISNDNLLPLKKNNFLKKFFYILFTTILSALIISLLIIVTIILILEIDLDLFINLRKLPEMIIFENDYYEPIKQQLLQSIQSIFVL